MKHLSHQCLSFRPPRRQSGAVLIVAMVILVILTLLGVTAMNTSSLEEKMASNTQEQVRTFQAAETGISQAGQDSDAFDTDGTCGVSDVVSIDFAGSGNSHTIEMDTSVLGLKSGTLTISSNAPDGPQRVVSLLGEVVGPCDACDADCDGQ